MPTLVAGTLDFNAPGHSWGCAFDSEGKLFDLRLTEVGSALHIYGPNGEHLERRECPKARRFVLSPSGTPIFATETALVVAGRHEERLGTVPGALPTPPGGTPAPAGGTPQLG